MDKKVHQLLNEQINKEFYSAYLYLDFANYFKAVGLDGFANWYTVQAPSGGRRLLFLPLARKNSE